MSWQAIETAPKGETVVAWCNAWYGEISRYITGDPFIALAMVYDDDDGSDPVRAGFIGPWWTECGGDAYTTWVRPTHWMPLPEAPQ